jgi:hypothetical protein
MLATAIAKAAQLVRSPRVLVLMLAPLGDEPRKPEKDEVAKV